MPQERNSYDCPFVPNVIERFIVRIVMLLTVIADYLRKFRKTDATDSNEEDRHSRDVQL
jgi:hypothetical protein